MGAGGLSLAPKKETKGGGTSIPRQRRTQAERSEEMRARLAKAAFDVIADRGHSALRTAAVAARAGVSQGAQVHHFSTKERLTIAALEYAFAAANDASARRLASIGPGENPLPLLLEDLREFFTSDKYWVSLDIAIDGSKNANAASDIRSIVRRYRSPVYKRWAVALSQAGWSDECSEEIVRTASSLMAGVSMRSLWEDVEVYLDDFVAKAEQMLQSMWPRTNATQKLQGRASNCLA